MSACPSLERLEASLRADLPVEERLFLRGHVGGCGACTEEVGWLEREAQMMAQHRSQAPALSPSLWRGVQVRLNPKPAASRSWHLGRVQWFELAAAALCAMLVTLPALPYSHRARAMVWPEALRMCAITDSTAHEETRAPEEPAACPVPVAAWSKRPSGERNFSAQVP